MVNPQSVSLLKEKLKEKDRELRKVELDRGKSDQRVKHVLKLAEEKITEMKEVIRDQTELIKHKDEVAEQNKTEIAEKEGDGNASVTQEEAESREVIVQDPNLTRQVEELRSKNEGLNDKIKTETKERKKLDKEKSILVKEYKRLKQSNEDIFKKLKKKLSQAKKEDPEKLEQIRQEKDGKIGELEKEIEESRKRTENFAQEKSALIKSYEAMLSGASEGENKGDRESPPEAGSLQAELEKIEQEKEELGKDLALERKQAEETIEKLQAELKGGGGGKKRPPAEQKKAETDCSECDPGAPAWMCTFADMVTLLMVFFVIFFSVNTDNTAKMLSVIEGTEDKALAMGVLEALDEVKLKESLKDLTGLGPGKGQFESTVEAELKKDIEKINIDGADVGRNGKKIFVNVPATNLFKPGAADLTKQGIPVLNKLAETFVKLTKYQINIAGHTDDSPISTARFPSNWELSSSRATAVLRFFADKGIDPLLMTATGRSDLFPLYSNSTNLGRSKNRRVEFVLEKEKK